MPRPRVTLVTYTYNDASLAHGLLEDCARWTLPPDAVLVVDDGSRVPFAPRPDGAGAPVEVLRLDPNRGPAGAKAAGLSRVERGVVVSLDCDIRPGPDWVRGAVERACAPGVGLVGAEIAWVAGDDPVSRYLARFGADAAGAGAGVLRGGAWVFAAYVWHEVAGFGDHGRRTHEDFVFCRRVAERGFALEVHEGSPVRQVRRIDRLALAAQRAQYVGRLLPGAAAARGLGPALEPLLGTVAGRLAAMDDSPAFVYLELLCFSAMVLSACSAGLATGPHAGSETSLPPAGFLAAVEDRLAEYPAVLDRLRSDCRALGLAPGSGPGELAPTRAFWTKILDVFAPCGHNGALGRLEGGLLADLVAEDARAPQDFHYVRGS